MNNFTRRETIVFLLLITLTCNVQLHAQTLTRGPYLQTGKQDSITIRWRTNTASNSKVTWGTSFGSYPNSLTQDVATPVTEHIVRIGGLSADTKYWYTIGTTTTTLQSTNTNYFLTLPPNNTNRLLRFLAVGDCGNNSTNQTNVKNTFMNYIGSNDIDAMLLVGDNAYTTGSDAEYQTNFFDIYKNDLLKYYKLYPAPGNHDYGNSSANTGKTGGALGSMPYHTNFTVPMAGEIGGYPSGAKNFYSYNIGNVHFVSLDSYGKDDNNTTKVYDTTGRQATWLKNDLDANTQKWTVVYFHHPPYTKTSHNADDVAAEAELVAVREKFIRILERYGVDLVICGHSHGYERSYLLKGFYNTYASPLLDADFSAASHTATGNTQNGLYDGVTGNYKAFTYNSGKYNHGTVYVVTGSAGQVGGTSTGYPEDCMYYSNATNGGCFYFEVDSNRLNAKFVSYTTAPTPLIRDQFTIFKDVKRKTNYSITLGQSIQLTASWRGTYNWTIPTNGFTAAGQVTQSILAIPDVTGVFDYIVSDDFNDLKDTFRVTVNTGALPILLNNFTANLDNNKVLLDWSTDVEQNNKYFTVERSTGGSGFQVLGYVNGAGNSNTLKNYHLVDPLPAEGNNYYRLSQTNYDGKRTYFDTRKVFYHNDKPLSCTVVRQSSGTKLIIGSTKPDNIVLRVVDMSGKEIANGTMSVITGNNSKELQLNNGVYIITLSNSTGDRISTKVVIE